MKRLLRPLPMLAVVCGFFAPLTAGCRHDPNSSDSELARIPGEDRPLIRPPGRKGKGVVYLSAVGDVPSPLMEELTRYYRRTLGLDCRIGPRMQIPKRSMNPIRGQVIDAVLLDMLLNHPLSRSCLIGITDKDMYAVNEDWRFAFSTRDAGPRGNAAIISMARMAPVFHGESSDESLRNARLRKMITRSLGFIYFELPPSHNPASTLFSQVMDLADLDRMGQGF